MDVVTGAAGFVGSALIRELLARGRSVRAVVRGGGPLPGVETVQADVRDPEATARALAGAERIFHCAARVSITGDPDGSVRAINVEGPRNVAKAAGGARVVHVSSVHAFAMAEELSETSPRPGPAAAAYDRSKAEGEEEIRRVAVIVNPTGILGPGDRAPSRIGSALLGFHRGQIPALVDGGFDWVDVRDVVAGILAAAERGRVGENYLLPGEYASLRRLAELVHDAGGAAPPRWSTPRWLAWASAPLVQWGQGLLAQEPIYTREALTTLWEGARVVRGDKARRELGHQPRPLAESVADSIAWFREAGRL